VHCQICGKQWTPRELPQHPVLIRKAELLRRIPLSYVTIWKMEQQGRFPKRMQLTAYNRTSFTPRSPNLRATE
jgi:predicted DNA-binding transcriptional regulator AlpA